MSITKIPHDDKLVIKGARVHNLKNLNLEIPRNSMVCFTGLSGSGKSSLAFDTIFAEGQRRYVESLSAYARQFLGQVDRPDVDFIEGLSPAVSIDQKSTNRNPRSTVGTITEIHDYLRLLWARIGIPHCAECGERIVKQTPQQIVDQIMQFDEGTRFQILAPIVDQKKGEFADLFRDLVTQGFARAVVDGETVQLSEQAPLKKTLKHDIAVVVDRLVAKADILGRLTDSVETALKLANGRILIDFVDREAKAKDKQLVFSERMSCPNVALLQAGKAAFDKLTLSGEEATGANIVRVAISAPLKQIALNAGLEPGVVAEKVANLPSGHGLNAATGEYVDMLQAGINDPVKVTRSALQNAASIAGLFLTTEAVVAEKPEPAAAPAAPAGGMDF